MPRTPWFPCWIAVAACLFLLAPLATASEAEKEPADPLAGLEPRNIGPLHPSGRVADVEGLPGDPRVLYVGSASGGIWKTTDGGLSFAPIFDDQPIASIGDLALAPSQPEVIYAGTGESNVRNSVSFGNGVYRSNDGGGHWQHLGLEETRHISRIVVHPSDPDTAWVGALGHIFAPNEERGVFRTRDGGDTWEKVLYTDDRHGVADLDLDPRNPNVLFAALWHFERKPWTMTSGSEEGGVYRSLDGGDTWKKLENGLPKLMGRIGVKIAPSNPQVVYVIAESNDGILFRSNDRGETFEKVNDDVQLVSRGFYYTDLRVDPTDENRVFAIASRLFRSIDGGKTFERISRNTHVDYHSLWIDPQDPNRIWQGQDGGVAVSYDRGDTWEPFTNLPIGQFYQVFYDLREPFYAVGGGMQDNGTWIGPSRTREPAGILSDDWRLMSFGDAYFVVPHPERVDLFLSEYQAGGIVRTDMRLRQQIDVSPQPRRNDGGPVEELEVRFNWNAPIIASPHDPSTVYFAGSRVFATTDFGNTWRPISPDLTTDDPEKQKTAGGPVWPENTTAEYHCTIISFAESPVEAGVLWAGTDDGNLQLSRDGGATWNNLIGNVPGVPEHSPVSHIEPSRAAAGTAYASFDRHMFQDYRPHLFKTTDFGQTWKRLGEGLPEEGWLWVVREDPVNTDLLYAGTEVGLYLSFDSGKAWQRANLGELPAVSVHDVLVHPRENDLIVGTHGRAIWILDDITPLQTWSEVAADDAAAHLFPVRDAMRFPTNFTRYGLGDKELVTPNPPGGALLTYYLAESLELEAKDGDKSEEEEGEGDKSKPEERLALEILDDDGQVLRTLDELPLGAGLHRVAWDLTLDPPRSRTGEKVEGSDFSGPPRGPQVLPGTYTARLTLDGRAHETRVSVTLDPLLVVSREDLQAQLDTALALRDQLSSVNDILKAIDLLHEQLKSRRATAEVLEIELSDELESQWKELEETLTEQLESLTRNDEKPFWSQGPRLADRIASLAGNVDSAFAAPTAAQSELAAELATATEEATASWKTFVEGELAAFSEALSRAGLPGLVVRIEAP